LSAGSRLCLCLTGQTLEADLRLVEEYRPSVSLLELRADFLTADEAAAAARFPGLARLPVILTVRRARDGGRFAGSEEQRVALLRRLAGGGFSFVELEEDLGAVGLEPLVEAAGGRIIRSMHDFSGVPADLAARVRRIARSLRELPKATVMTRGAADLARLLAASEELSGVEKVLLGMGDCGFAARVLASRLGSLICYSSAPGASAAPGQADPRTLESVYRFSRIDPDTAIYGVIGNPVMHSLSPLIHNRGFAALGMNAVYLPFLVDDLAAFGLVADSLGIRGLSVTVPLKEAVLPLLARQDQLVEALGACNTMTRTAEGAGPGAPAERGGWAGTNTDVEGFLSPLRSAFGGKIPRGLRATVIGAGGASRAVLHALLASGADVLLLNRTEGRARELARRFPVRTAPLDEDAPRLARGYSDLIVQASSAGMEPGAGIDPFPGCQFTGREVVYELVYAPPVTAFLDRARRAGCGVIFGQQMLMAQAREQFRLFTGSELPAEAEEPRRENIHETPP
jgi:3-dehydroquinate dehydratase/shikimate dehydrogenase